MVPLVTMQDKTFDVTHYGWFDYNSYQYRRSEWLYISRHKGVAAMFHNLSYILQSALLEMCQVLRSRDLVMFGHIYQLPIHSNQNMPVLLLIDLMKVLRDANATVARIFRGTSQLFDRQLMGCRTWLEDSVLAVKATGAVKYA